MAKVRTTENYDALVVAGYHMEAGVWLPDGDANPNPTKLMGNALTAAQRLPTYQVNASGFEASIVNIGADGFNIASVNALGSRAMIHGYNGVTADMWRNNTEGTLLPSLLRTVTTVSPNQTNYNGICVQASLRVTTASGTGGLIVIFQGLDVTSGQWYDLNQSPAAVIAIGGTVYEIGLGAGGPVSFHVKQSTARAIPRTWRVTVSHGDASDYTYSLSYSLTR